MAGADRVQFNTLERAVSADFNDMESMKDRVLLDAMRQIFAQKSVLLGLPTDTARNAVGGLNVTPSGNDVQIGVGVLWQESPTLAPAPGALDSTYRIAFQRAASVFTMPAPGVTTYYLLEAQMNETITLNQMRDIFNPGLGVFVPTAVDKRAERLITFQLLTGNANAPAPTGGDWVPIAIIRRPAGGGAVASSDIIDVRPFTDDFAAGGGMQTFNAADAVAATKLSTTHQPGAAASNNVSIKAVGYSFGRRMAFEDAGAFDVTAASFIDPTTVLAASTWYYLYLAPWSASALLPNQGYRAVQANSTTRGVLVLSHIAPTQGGVVNNGNLNLPAPFGITTVGAFGGAVCVGALRRNAANTGWDWQQSMGGGWFQIEPVGNDISLTPPAVGANAVNISAAVPAVARSVRLTVASQDAGGGAGTFIDFGPTGGGLGNQWDRMTVGNAGGAANSETAHVDIPVLSGAGSGVFDVTTAAALTSILGFVNSYGV